eukprot:3557144-Amphidinium_carterae.1
MHVSAVLLNSFHLVCVNYAKRLPSTPPFALESGTYKWGALVLLLSVEASGRTPTKREGLTSFYPLSLASATRFLFVLTPSDLCCFGERNPLPGLVAAPHTGIYRLDDYLLSSSSCRPGRSDRIPTSSGPSLCSVAAALLWHQTRSQAQVPACLKMGALQESWKPSHRKWNG